MKYQTRSAAYQLLRGGRKRRRSPLLFGASTSPLSCCCRNPEAVVVARKEFGASQKKQRVNSYIAGLLAAGGAALLPGGGGENNPTRPVAFVIDAEGVCTTKALLKARPDAVVHTANFDASVCEEATAAGAVGHTGVSTDVLRHLRDTAVVPAASLAVGYLDYCGSPDGNVGLGFAPDRDLACLEALLQDDGVGLVTFCRRTRGGSALRKARTLFARAGLVVVREHTYCETSPMVLYLVTKKHAMDARVMRRVARAFHAEVVATKSG